MSVEIHNNHQAQGAGGFLKNSNLNSTNVYNTNYVLVVLNVMQKFGLGPLEGVMETESKLMNVTAKIQSDLTTIQQYLTQIQNLATSGGTWYQGGGSANLGYSPNGFNGIAYNEFHENQNLTNPGAPFNFNYDPNNYTVSADFQNATQNFIAAFKDLFISTPCQAGDPNDATNFSHFSVTKMNGNGNSVTQTFNLGSIYDSLNSNSNGWGEILKQCGRLPFAYGNQPGMSAPLIQQYTFYQYKLAAESHTGLVPNNNLNSLGFNMDPTSSSCDGIGQSLFNLMNSFNTTVTADRQTDGGEYAAELSNKTGNFLNYIFSSNPYAFNKTGAPNPYPNNPFINGCAGEYYVNIFGAFSEAAFNYFWTKNPSASVSQDPNLQPIPTINGQPDGAYSWADDKGDVTDGDKLSNWYSNSQSSSSLVSSNSNEASTTMQEYTSEVSEYQNIGQNIIQNSSQNNMATVQNYKTG